MIRKKKEEEQKEKAAEAEKLAPLNVVEPTEEKQAIKEPVKPLAMPTAEAVGINKEEPPGSEDKPSLEIKPTAEAGAAVIEEQGNPEDDKETTDELGSVAMVEEEKPSALKYILLGMLVGVVLAGLLAGGLYVSSRALGSKEETASETPAPAENKAEDNKEIVEEVEEEATEEAKPDEETASFSDEEKAALSLEILNGSGKAGAAGEMATWLKDKGYEKIETGNASKYDYEESVIQVKEEKADWGEVLLKDLTDKYAVSSKIETLAEKEKFEVIIIVGSKRAAE